MAWARFVMERVWPSTPRTIEVLGRSKRVFAVSLATYAVGMLTVRVFDGAFHRDASGVAWPGWGVIMFLGAALAGAAAAWRTLRAHRLAE
jgi:hypothetical protein